VDKHTAIRFIIATVNHHTNATDGINHAMNDGDGFATELAELDVSNVFIYVGDAVRWDEVPGSVHDRGTSLRTIAASTWSPSSFASIVTGLYTPSHGVRSFDNRISPDIPTLFDETYNTRFVNSIFEYAERIHGEETDPIYAVLDVDPPQTESTFDDLAEPFICMERGPGGHAPWGEHTGAATSYFENQKRASVSELRSDYRRSIELDAKLFGERLQDLEAAGIRNNTLVIYTSDHGEIVGERGLLGHSGPMCPELVYVPLVFAHPRISERMITEANPHHVDLVPTIRSILGLDRKAMTDGVDLTERVPTGPRACRYEHTFLPDMIPHLTGDLRYDGVWDGEGGHVFRQNTLTDGMAVYFAKLLKSSKGGYMRRNVGAGIRCYAKKQTTYGNPDFSPEAAKDHLMNSVREMGKQADAELTEEGKEQLENLGYI